ncbi:nucleoside deaminase [Stenotrophomonas sp. YIM B06876]|uniref:nucleoside deaminase n=1 Tax=Stenotrophomonas sp. YIM B06876 TaxID=3060211 RepID=UPI0027389BE6|nr:nucleoside deaminase [Stenotrophomonas sp. YIM B06876]
MSDHEGFMRQAIELARRNVVESGRPFGAVLVKDGVVIATGTNTLHLSHDPTDHAELRAIRQASAHLRSPRLEGCVIYASGHPCPMCLAAMYLSGIGQAWFAYSNEDAQPYGLSTDAVYARLAAGPAAAGSGLRQLRPSGEAGLYAQWADAGR